MAVLDIGLPRTKAAFNTNLGTLAVDLWQQMQEAVSAAAVLDTLTSADLEALGYTANEVTYLKSAVAEMAGWAAHAAANNVYSVQLRGVIGS